MNARGLRHLHSTSSITFQVPDLVPEQVHSLHAVGDAEPRAEVPSGVEYAIARSRLPCPPSSVVHLTPPALETHPPRIRPGPSSYKRGYASA